MIFLRKILDTGISNSDDLTLDQQVIRLINTIALIGLISTFVSEVYVLLFVDFYLLGILMATIACTVFLSVFYFNRRGLYQYPKYTIIVFINFAIIYTSFLIESTLGIVNIYFSAFVLYVAILKSKKNIILLSALTLVLMLFALYIHEYKVIEPLLHFLPAQVFPIKFIFTTNAAILVLLITFFLKTNMDNYQNKIELANEKLNEALIKINTQKKELEESLDEKKVLLKEIHHRIKNNFQIIISLLDLQVDGLKDNHAKVVLNEAKLRINSMAIIHQRLYQSESLKRISIHSYFQQIINDNIITFPQTQTKVFFDLSFTDFELNMEQAVPLGLIFNELITNFFKHVVTKTNKPKISISINKHENIVSFVAKDNGEGLSDALLAKAPENSLGSLLIEMLVRQLNGNLKKSNNGGLITEIQFRTEE